MAHTWMTGMEHGVFSVSGQGIFSSQTGTPTINSTSTYVRTGSYSIRFYKTSSGVCYGTRNISSTYVVSRFYIRFTTLPAAKAIIWQTQTSTPSYFKIQVTSGGVISAQINSGTEQTGPTLSTGVWYCVETRTYSGGSTYTLDWQVDHVAQTQATASSSNVAQSYVNFGSFTSTTYDFYMDDMVLSLTSGDYPLGAGAIVGLVASSDGAHSNPSNYMQNQLGNPIDGSSYMAYSYVNNLPMSGNAKYVQQATTDSTNSYCIVNFASFSAGTPIRVQGWLSYFASGTSQNNGKTYIEGDAEDTLFSGDMSESSVYYKGAPITVSGSWTQAKVNALYAKFGLSGDASPVPRWCAIMLEVDYITVTSKSVTDSGSGSDATPGITARVPASDLGSGSDALTAPSVKVPQTESGNAVDALEIEAEFGLSDSGSGADVAEKSSAVPKSVDDSGAGLDSDPGILGSVPQSDSGAGSESLLVEGSIPASDSGSGSESTGVMSAVGESDAGSGSESDPAILARVPVPDLGSGAEALLIDAEVPVSDLGSGLDAEAVGSGPQDIAVADSGSGADADPAVHVEIPIGDVGVGGYVKIGGAWAAATIYVKVGGQWVPK